MFDPVSFLVIMVCKTAQHLIACFLVLMIFSIAINRK